MTENCFMSYHLIYKTNYSYIKVRTECKKIINKYESLHPLHIHQLREVIKDV